MRKEGESFFFKILPKGLYYINHSSVVLKEVKQGGGLT